jgi:ABC-type multidrug transport system permease subunit
MQGSLYRKLRFYKFVILVPVTVFIFFMSIMAGYFRLDNLWLIPLVMFIFFLSGMYYEYFHWCAIEGEVRQ